MKYTSILKKKEKQTAKGPGCPGGTGARISRVALCPLFTAFLMNINIESQSDGSLNALVALSSPNPNS